jgi:hypothetical protein
MQSLNIVVCVLFIQNEVIIGLFLETKLLYEVRHMG